jgi:cation diffusion facilitator family transporter
MAGGGGDPVKVIRAALYANAAIAVVKFIAAYISGSTATLAEAVHSVADTGNQGLLLVGVHLASKRNDELYAFGRAAERYFWPFIVALILFSVGGAFSLYEGIHKLHEPSVPDMSNFWSLKQGPLVSLLVLGVSAAFETYSCTVALAEFKKGSGGRTIKQALFGGKDPTIPLVLMEDIAALTGLVVAFAAVGLAALTGNGVFDAVGSMLIGALLMAIAVVIAKDAHSLLIGERAALEAEQRVQELTEKTPGVRGVTQLLTMHHGPDFVVLAMKVAFEPGTSLERVEEIINQIEQTIRGELPDMKKIFIEPDSKGDLRGVVRRAATA